MRLTSMEGFRHEGRLQVNQRRRKLLIAVAVGMAVGALGALVGHATPSRIFGNLLCLALCIVGSWSVLLGVLLARGVLSPGGWAGSSVAARLCFGAALLLEFAPGLVIPEANRGTWASFSTVAHQVACALLLASVLVVLRDRKRLHAAESGSANV